MQKDIFSNEAIFAKISVLIQLDLVCLLVREFNSV